MGDVRPVLLCKMEGSVAGHETCARLRDCPMLGGVGVDSRMCKLSFVEV